MNKWINENKKQTWYILTEKLNEKKLKKCRK